MQRLSPFLPILAFFIILFVYIQLAGPIPFSVNSVTTTKSDAFTVSGEGIVAAKPDTAFLNVGVTQTAPTVKAVQDQLNSAANKVSEAVKNLGVKAEDIQTTNYSVNPNYDFREVTQRIIGYTASTNLKIKVREIDKINEVIDAATASGANQVGGVSFEVSDKDQVENKAREEAVRKAKKKAEDAAKIAGFKLGKLINYSEELPSGPIPIYAQGAAVSERETNIEPGSSEIRVTVNLTYEVL